MEKTIEEWQEAQRGEKMYHDQYSFERGYAMYANSYSVYFKYLSIDKDLNSKSILEIGCAHYPALTYCERYNPSFIIEPMDSKILNGLIVDKLITLIKKPAEILTEFPKVDEVWIMNVLQHVINPDIVIEKAKACADLVRFFEPIETEISSVHLHTFDLNYFKKHFGDGVVKYYAPKEYNGADFHEHQCAYGVWLKKTE